MASRATSPKNLRWLALVVLVAVILRTFAIDRLPPGLFGDEAVEGLDALDVLSGNLSIWFHAHLGREPIFVYLVAASYKFLGVTPFATRLPALLIGLLTLPATFYLVREWGNFAIPLRSPLEKRRREELTTRLAILTAGLLAVSFWDIQMNRNAHRDNLLPLVEAVGYYFLWRGIRTADWKYFAAAGAILGLSIYTYSPGRFVGLFVAVFFVTELSLAQFTKHSVLRRTDWGSWLTAAACALVVMAPLGIYFAANPDQFVRRFDSASIFNSPQPLAALSESIVGNLAQFVIPGAGYQSKHYNIPGKPVFDLFLAPWFLAGIVLTLTRLKNSAYRFLLLWFIVMLMPPFLTGDMIPKGVRGLGTMPGVLMFIAVAMDWVLQRLNGRKFQGLDVSSVVIAMTFAGTIFWTTYDYFVTWANLPELATAFDSDYAETASYVRDLPPSQQVHLSAETYRHPTYMLLGEYKPTSRYLDRASRIREFDGTTLLVNAPTDVTIFVRDQSPPEDWYRRVAPRNDRIDGGKYFAAYRLHELASPQVSRSEAFSPLLTLDGFTRFADDPPGFALYWRIVTLPDDRTEMKVRVTLLDGQGQVVARKEHRFGYPPLEWGLGESIVEWYEFDSIDNANAFTVELMRGDKNWKSSPIQIK